MDRAKPFCIAKREVWEASERVKANQGAAGVDGKFIEGFDTDLSNNLYRIWNRMSSGRYFPPPVRRSSTRPLKRAYVYIFFFIKVLPEFVRNNGWDVESNIGNYLSY